MKNLIITFLLLASSVLAAEKISYSGRLIQPSTGAPLSGPLTLTFEILVDNSNRCSITIPAVNLSNGVFNVEFDYATTCDTNTKKLSEIITEAVNANQSLEIRVTEGSNTYTAQKINNTPLALFAQKANSVTSGSLLHTSFKGISSNCADGKVIKTNNSGEFICADDISGASGTVTGVNSGVATAVTNPTTSAVIDVKFDNASIAVNGSNELEVKAGGVNNSKLASDIDAGKIATGTLGTARIPSLDVSKITTGTFGDSFIPSLDTSKITTGTFVAARIPSITSTMIADSTIKLEDFAAECLPGEILKFQAGPIFVACASDDDTSLWNENTGDVYRTSGKVGIGISTPATNLHILSDQPATEVHPNRAGFILESEGTSIGGRMALKVYSDIESPLFVGYRARGTKASPSPLLLGDQISGFAPVGYDGAGGWQTGAHIRYNATEDWGATNIGSSITFRTPSNGTTSALERMKIDHNGNVGIATISPSEKLDVNGTVKATSFKGDGSQLTGISASNSSNTTNAVITADSDANTSGDIIFNTGSSERARITNSGNFGIGTNSPTAKLQVNGNIIAGSSNTNFNSSNYVVGNSNQTLNATSSAIKIFGASNTYDTTLTNFSYNSMTVGNSNSVTNSGNAMVYGNSNTLTGASNSYVFGGNNTISAMSTYTYGKSLTNNVASSLMIGNTDAAKMTVTNSAFGFGTTPTSSFVHLNKTTSMGTIGGLSAANSVLRIQESGSVNMYMDGNTIMTDSLLQMGTKGASDLTLFTNDSARLSISGTGNIGVGTSTPTALFHVESASGNVRLTGEGVEIYRNPATTPTDTGGYIDFKDDAAADYDTRLYFNAVLDGMTFKGRAGANLVQIGNDGKVGIGVASPSEQLEVANNVKATSYLTTSDRRLKKEIHPIDSALEKVLKLNGVSFVWKKNDLKTYGFIAQEVEEIFPELVVTNQKSGLKAVKYANLVAPVVEAIKALHRKVASLEEENDKLKEKIERQDKAMQSIIERLEKIEKGQ